MRSRDKQEGESRRLFLAGSAAWAAVLGASACAGQKPAEEPRSDEGSAQGKTEEEISPTEDLMREHGVLDRALLVYEAALARFVEADPSPIPTVAKTADLLRRFIEDYHERLEEQFVFPRLESRLPALVATLRLQHDRGRAVTDEILRLTRSGGSDLVAQHGRLSELLRAYIRMYRPHAAREETVLFPAFREVVKGHEYEELGERFEEREHALFGARGFEAIVDDVAGLERELHIEDLAAFTP